MRHPGKEEESDELGRMKNMCKDPQIRKGYGSSEELSRTPALLFLYT